MFVRFALCTAAMAVVLAAPQPSFAQSQTQAPPAAATAPDAAPAPADESKDPFGEDANLTAKPIVYVKGTSTWDSAFETVTHAFKTLRTFVDKQGLKPDGSVMTIFTATDDAGFQFEAAIPIVEPPKNPPHGEIAVGASPAGHALKFVHRGSYDGLDNTYEAITNYLDEKRLEAKDMFIEEYVTDPLSTKEDDLVVNVFVLIK